MEEKELCTLCCAGSGKFKGHPGRHRRKICPPAKSKAKRGGTAKVYKARGRTANRPKGKNIGRKKISNIDMRGRSVPAKNNRGKALSADAAWNAASSEVFYGGNEKSFRELVSSIMVRGGDSSLPVSASVPDGEPGLASMLGELSAEDMDMRFFGQQLGNLNAPDVPVPPHLSSSSNVTSSAGGTSSVFYAAARRAQNDLLKAPKVHDSVVVALKSYAEGAHDLFQTLSEIQKAMSGRGAKGLRAKLALAKKRAAKAAARKLEKEKAATAAIHRRLAAAEFEEDDEEEDDESPYAKKYTTSASTRKRSHLSAAAPILGRKPAKKRGRNGSAAASGPRAKRRDGPATSSPKRSRLSNVASTKNLNISQCKTLLKEYQKQIRTVKHRHRKNVLCARCKLDQKIRALRKRLDQGKRASSSSGASRPPRRQNRPKQALKVLSPVASLGITEDSKLVDLIDIAEVPSNETRTTHGKRTITSARTTLKTSNAPESNALAAFPTLFSPQIPDSGGKSLFEVTSSAVLESSDSFPSPVTHFPSKVISGANGAHESLPEACSKVDVPMDALQQNGAHQVAETVSSLRVSAHCAQVPQRSKFFFHHFPSLMHSLTFFFHQQ